MSGEVKGGKESREGERRSKEASRRGEEVRQDKPREEKERAERGGGEVFIVNSLWNTTLHEI